MLIENFKIEDLHSGKTITKLNWIVSIYISQLAILQYNYNAVKIHQFRHFPMQWLLKDTEQRVKKKNICKLQSPSLYLKSPAKISDKLIPLTLKKKNRSSWLSTVDNQTREQYCEKVFGVSIQIFKVKIETR